MREGGYDLGLAMDGDADRIAIVDDQGTFISTNELLLLLYYYLHEVRGERGGVTRNLATTHLLDRLAAHFGEPCYEVPVGFKHLAASMKEHDVLLAGESSGGLSIRGHILGKDGIFACALVVEMMARTGRTHLRHARRDPRHHRPPGQPRGQPAGHVRDEGDGAAHAGRRPICSEIAGHAVVRISHDDGAKFYLENDNWLLLRFSGTEPLLRIFAEADDEAEADDAGRAGQNSQLVSILAEDIAVVGPVSMASACNTQQSPTRSQPTERNASWPNHWNSS